MDIEAGEAIQPRWARVGWCYPDDGSAMMIAVEFGDEEDAVMVFALPVPSALDLGHSLIRHACTKPGALANV